MISQTKEQTGFIKMVASSLAEKFMEPLFLLSKEKNHSASVGGLAEILDWAQEFYDRFYDTIINWERFGWSADNIYNVADLDGFIVAFGQEKLKNFYAQNANHSTYFIEKYLAVTSG